MENAHKEREEVTEGASQELRVDAKAGSRDIRISKKSMIMAALVIALLAILFSVKGLFIAATVDGSPVSRMAVIHKLEQSSGKATLDSLITVKLINTAARKAGVEVGDDEINAEIAKVEEQVAAQGMTLDALLSARGLTRDDIVEQVLTQKQVEKLLGEKVAVADGEIDEYVKENKIELPKGEEEKNRILIGEQLKQQKISMEGQKLVNELRTAAKISYFVKY